MLTGIRPGSGGRPPQAPRPHRQDRRPHSLSSSATPRSSGRTCPLPQGGRDPDEVARYARDLPPDGSTVSCSTQLLGLGLGIGLLYLVGGWEIALIASVVHTVFYLSATAPSTPSATTGVAAPTTIWPQQPVVGVAGGREACTTTTTRPPPPAVWLWPRGDRPGLVGGAAHGGLKMATVRMPPSRRRRPAVFRPAPDVRPAPNVRRRLTSGPPHAPAFTDRAPVDEGILPSTAAGSRPICRQPSSS